MRLLLTCVLAFFLVIAETVVATMEGRADRQSTYCRDSRFSRRAALWAGAFEIVLILSVRLIVGDNLYVYAAIVAGAIVGKYGALERRRKKFRRRKRAASTRTQGSAAPPPSRTPPQG